MTRLCLLAVLLATAAPAKTITNDPGGRVWARAEEILSHWSAEIRVVGRCASACTMYLGMPNACTSKGARWVFHGPRGGVGAENIMAGFYPEPIRSLFLADYQFREVTLRGAELIRLGVIKECT